MSEDQCIELLGKWEGYQLGTVGRRHEEGSEGAEEAWIELVPIRGRPMRCSGCGRFVSQVHDTRERWIRDLPLFDAETWLLVHRRRVACPRCGPKLEWLGWLGRYSRVTRRLAQNVARMCTILPVKHVAEFFGLGWKVVKDIDKTTLREALEPADLSDVEQIVMDEFAIQKGHRYATVVVEPTQKRVLWVGRGRSREDVRPFF